MINKTRAKYYAYKKAPKICKGYLESVSIHTVINSKQDVCVKNSHHTQNTINFFKSLFNRLKDTRIALERLGGNCGADPRRKYRVQKWLNKLNKV